MSTQEELLNRNVALDKNAALTRLTALCLSMICDPRSTMIIPGLAERIHVQDDETKVAIIAELTRINAIELVEGVYVPTPTGRSINAKLTSAAIRGPHEY